LHAWYFENKGAFQDAYTGKQGVSQDWAYDKQKYCAWVTLSLN